MVFRILLCSFIFCFFTSERLKHPNFIVFVLLADLFLVWCRFISLKTRLNWSFEFILLLGTRRSITFGSLCWGSVSFGLVIWSSSCVALTWAHKPLVHLFISLKYALIMTLFVLVSKSTFLSNNKIYFGDDWTITSRVITCRRRRFCLQLRVYPVLEGWRGCIPIRSIVRYIGTIRNSTLLQFNLDCSFLFWNWQTTRPSLEWELEYSTGGRLTVLRTCFSICDLLGFISMTSRCRIDGMSVCVVLLSLIFFNHLNVCRFIRIKDRRRRIVP